MVLHLHLTRLTRSDPAEGEGVITEDPTEASGE